MLDFVSVYILESSTAFIFHWYVKWYLVNIVILMVAFRSSHFSIDWSYFASRPMKCEEKKTAIRWDCKQFQEKKKAKKNRLFVHEHNVTVNETHHLHKKIHYLKHLKITFCICCFGSFKYTCTVHTHILLNTLLFMAGFLTHGWPCEENFILWNV